MHNWQPFLTALALLLVIEGIMPFLSPRGFRDMLRQVVTRGTASFGEVPGYAVGGKTGTADKPRPQGGYYDDKVIATFASVFPADDPQYVLVVTLDEPSENSGAEPRRTAGWTAVPVAAEMIRREFGTRREEILIPGAGLVHTRLPRE